MSHIVFIGWAWHGWQGGGLALLWKKNKSKMTKQKKMIRRRWSDPSHGWEKGGLTPPWSKISPQRMGRAVQKDVTEGGGQDVQDITWVLNAFVFSQGCLDVFFTHLFFQRFVWIAMVSVQYVLFFYFAFLSQFYLRITYLRQGYLR